MAHRNSGYLNHNRMIRFLMIVFGLMFILSSCNTLRLSNVVYNDSKELFEYQSGKMAIELRNEQMQLVDSSNIEDFKIELYENNFKYPFSLRTENSYLLNNTDWELSVLYDEINKSLRNGDYKNVFSNAWKARDIYPDIDLYSDLPFLEGYALEMLGLDSLAGFKYEQFLRSSGKKYSDRQRGYEYADINDSMFVSQRKYSRKFLLSLPRDNKITFNPVPPKYYYNPYQPGYSISESLNQTGKTYLRFLIGNDLSGGLSYGMQIYKSVGNSVSIFAQGMYSGNMSYFSFGAPVQLYKSADNGLGLKISPFISYYSFNNISSGNSGNKGFLDLGGKLSAGFFLFPNLSIGAYYQYFFHNETNKYRLSPELVIWNMNEYDISAYFNIFKNLSFKAGIKNSDVVVGLFISGWEISYSIKNNGFIFRTDIF